MRVAALGRFQPFHWGHFEYLLMASQAADEFVVGITNPSPERMRVSIADPDRTHESANPFSFQERKEMILLSMQRLAIRMETRPCDLRSPALLRGSLGSCDLVAVTVYDAWGWERVALLKAAGYEVNVLWERVEKIVCGAEVRRRIRSGLPWEHLVPAGTATVVRRRGSKGM